MQDDFLMLGTNEVVDDVRGRGIATRVAEPFGTDETLYDGGWVVYSAVAIVFVGQRESLQVMKRGVRTSTRVVGGQPGSLP
jgi:hypothetical protein